MSPVYLLASPPGQPFRQSEATFPAPHIPAPPPPCARVCLAHTLPIWNVTLYVTLCFTLFIDPFVFQCPAERRSMTSGGSRAARSRPVIGAAVASDRLWAHTPHLHSRHSLCASPPAALCLFLVRRYKMGDGYAAFWRHAHKSEPIVVYSVILGVLGACPALPPLPTPHWLRTGIFPSRHTHTCRRSLDRDAGRA